MSVLSDFFADLLHPCQIFLSVKISLEKLQSTDMWIDGAYIYVNMIGFFWETPKEAMSSCVYVNLKKNI